MPDVPPGPPPSQSPLTIFIPAYNEETIVAGNIDRLRTYLKDRGITEYEIILASNGSTDRTVEIARRCGLGRDDLQVIVLPGRGVGRAFKEGVSRARHEKIICLDLDLTVDLAFIESAATLLANVDIVIGSKQTGAQQRSWIRRQASASFIASARCLLGLEFTDYSIGAKAYRRQTVQPYLQSLAQGSAYVVQIIAWAKRESARITEIPVWCEDLRKSKFNLPREGIYRFGSLFLLWFQERIMRGRAGREGRP
jgi:glycosyltransferase involved in cell wall biosynthesis